jgi:hypothetical protein
MELFIKKDEVDAEKMLSLFRSASFEVEQMDSSNIIVKGQLPVLLSIDKNRSLVRFFVAFDAKKGLDELSTLRWINRLNRQYFMVRIYIDGYLSKDLQAISEYSLSFNAGLTADQIIDNFRSFQEISKDILDDMAIEKTMWFSR